MSLATAKEQVENARKITFLTGAGISTASGIPDYRGTDGVWTKNPRLERDSNIQAYMKNPRRGLEALGIKFEDYEPNAAHEAIVRVYDANKLWGLVTTNVDGLHRASGLPDSLVVEAHGRFDQTKCLGCEKVTEGALRANSFTGSHPTCPVCAGTLKPNVVMFGEYLNYRDITIAVSMAEACDLFIAVGTTLKVPPMNGLILNAGAAGAYTIIINNQPTELDSQANLVLNGDASEILPALVADL